MIIDANRLRTFVKESGLTHTDLAAKAGITRQAIHAILKENQTVEVRDKTLKGLVQALRLADASLLSPDPLARYKQAVAEEHADLSFAGLGLPTADPKSMDEVFVPIRVVQDPEKNREEDCPPAVLESEGAFIEEPEDRTIQDCLALHRRVLIRGEPGSGKTTALRQAARMNAQGRTPGPPRIPLLVRLADFAKALEQDKEMTLVRFVATRTLRDAASDYWAQVEHFLQAELSRGACLVLFDGLDEVGADGRLFSMLNRFVDEHGQNHFALTSRIVGLDSDPWRKLDFISFQVAPWGDEEIRKFARAWHGARPIIGKNRKKILEQEAEDFTAAIMAHPPLRAIASNPLMLTILAALHYANASLPRRRVDLYAKIVEVMLETCEKHKRVARSGDPLHGIHLEGREFGWLLGRLALGMQREGRTLRPRWWVHDHVQDFLREQMALEGTALKEQGERVIRYLCERTGLFVERGDGIFGFGHRTFQEYFAARGLLLESEGGGDLIGLLRPYLYRPQWEEVVVYVMASLTAPRATSLMRVILDDPDPAGRFIRRGQRLALRGLADGAAIADRALLDQIFSEGELMGRSRWLGISIGLLRLLNHLQATRHEARARQMRHQIEEAAKGALSERDYLILYSSSHDPPAPPKEDVPGTICPRRLGGRQINLIWPARGKRLADPKKWYAEAVKRARNTKMDIGSRKVLISLLGEEADTDDRARRPLMKLLEGDPKPEIRSECAEALEGAVSSHAEARELLLERLHKDDSDLVRASCAMALRDAAPNQPEVFARLDQLFGKAPAVVRAGAARGLSRVVLSSPDRNALLRRILATIESAGEPPMVRTACIWAAASSLGKEDIASAVIRCLEDANQKVKNAALHVLADAITEGQMEWSRPLADKLETMLLGINAPCPHLFADLVALVALKEERGRQRLDQLLWNALEPFDDRIQIAFIFGSVARLDQVKESDLDLMILGNMRLKDTASALHQVEQFLGRPINPVIFSTETFREQYRQGNPFLLNVVRQEKIFVKGNREELTELVADGAPD